MSRYTTPRTPANEGDVLLPLRETTHLLEDFLVQTGQVPLVAEREAISDDVNEMERPAARTSALERKVDDLVACLNKLTRAVSGR